jgi:hypothetical protein
LLVPARDGLHIRLHSVERTDSPFPLIGDTPLSPALGDIALFERIQPVGPIAPRHARPTTRRLYHGKTTPQTNSVKPPARRAQSQMA